MAYGEEGVGECHAFNQKTLGMKTQTTNPLYFLCLFPPAVGDLIPGSAVLVFDIHVIDFHNPNDPIHIKVTRKPEGCSMKSETDDLIQYRYNCSLMDGTLLYSSWAPSAVVLLHCILVIHACNHCLPLVW